MRERASRNAAEPARARLARGSRAVRAPDAGTSFRRLARLTLVARALLKHPAMETLTNKALLAAAIAAALVVGCKRKEATEASVTTATSAAVTATPTSAEPPCKDDQNKTVATSGPAAGSVTRCLLTKNYSVDGYECEAGKIADFYGAGKLQGCYLTSAKTIDGYSCKEGVSLYPDGHLKRCKTTQAKHVADGVDVRQGEWVTLYKSGAIKRLELSNGPNKILGMPCRGYWNYFHENGRLKKCELSEDTVIEGKKVASKGPKDAAVYVCFDDAGKRVADCNLLTGFGLD